MSKRFWFRKLIVLTTLSLALFLPSIPALAATNCSCTWVDLGKIGCSYRYNDPQVKSQSACESICRGYNVSPPATAAYIDSDPVATDTYLWCRGLTETGLECGGGKIKDAQEKCVCPANTYEKNPGINGVCITCPAGQTWSTIDDSCIAPPPPPPPPPEPPRDFIAPNLEFPFPDLVANPFSKVVAKNDTIGVNWMGEYIAALYNYLLGISVTIAIVMVMIGGLQYVMAAGSGDTKAAKERITNAVTGLVLLFCVYLLLFLVNPALTLFNPLTLTQVQRIEEEEDDVVSGTVATNTTSVTGNGLLGPGLSRIPVELGPKLQAAGIAVQAKGYSMYVTSSFRALEEQIALIRLNCQNPPGSATCNKKPGRPTTCILKDNNPANCPHTTGRALDIWGWKTGGQCISMENCLSNKVACRADPCQAAVIAAMKANGFCNLASEPWHFEQPKMSTTCN